jgi:predicted  nucleic acid-binding Zn-ribbon protein
VKNRFAARRAARQKAAAAAATPIILAAAAGTEFAALERQLAKHECASCKGIFEVNAAALDAPFCVHCGSEQTSLVKATAEAANMVRHAAPEEADVTAVQCASADCKSLNIFGNETLSTIKSFHCVTCGTHLVPKLACDPAAMPEPNPAAVDPAAPAGDANAAGQPNDGGQVISPDKPGVGADPRQSPTTKPSPGADPAQPSPNSGSNPNGQPGEATFSGEDDEAKPPVGEPEDKPPVGEDPAPAGDPAADPAAGPDADVLEVDMCDMIDGPADKPAEAEMLMTDDVAYIKVGAHFVAQLTKAEAGDNKDIFGTDAFIQAVGTVLNKEGLKPTMAAFGFKPITIKVSVKAKVKQMVESGVATAKSELETANKQRDESFAQCLSISILGHSTGYFADVENPLAVKLVAALEELNVRGAKRIVANVLAETAKDFASSVVGKAVELLSSDVKYRNDIATNLDKLNPTAASQDDDEGLEHRLEAGVRQVTSRTEQHAHVEPQGTTGKPRVAALLASRRAGSMSPYGAK